MKTRLGAQKTPKNAKRAAQEQVKATKTLGAKRVARLSAEVTGDTYSERGTSRSKSTEGKTYMRPMSAIDVAKAKNLPVRVVRKALGSRQAVVRRYRQAMAHRIRRGGF